MLVVQVTMVPSLCVENLLATLATADKTRSGCVSRRHPYRLKDRVCLFFFK